MSLTLACDPPHKPFMAHDETQRNFRRLKLDTSGWQITPSQHDIENTGIPVPASQLLGRIVPLSPVASTRIPEEDFYSVARHDVDTRASSKKEMDENCLLQRDMSTRRTSITFDPQVIRDDGRKGTVNQPVLFEERPRRPREARGRSMMQELQAARERTRTHSESDRSNYDPVTGERIESGHKKHNYRRGESRWPLLQRTTDELADENGYMQSSIPSLTSNGSTNSPQADYSCSPSFIASDQCLSPDVASSPIQFPSLNDSGVLPSPPRLRESQRTRSSINIERPSPFRRLSRRSSTRSGSSAKSPASTYLSKWHRDPSSSVDPDEDGQTIGDDGEYVIGRQIGYGGFSVVKEVYSFENNRQIMRAVKIVRKHVQGKEEDDNDKLQDEFEHEVSIWRHLRHEFILPLVAVFSSPFATFCIMQMNTGGTLFDLVRSRRRRSPSTFPSDHFGEEQLAHIPSGDRSHDLLPLDLVRHYLQQLASALRYLHQDMRVIHRDIKLENCLISTQTTSLDEDPETKLLLCDFGMADFIDVEGREEPTFENTFPDPAEQNEETESSQIIGPAGTSTNIAGSLQYASPELIKASKPLFRPSIDMWAFGVVAYALLTTDLPFKHSFLPKLQMMILKGKWNSTALLDACGDRHDAVELIHKCLLMDQHLRWTIGDVLHCAFLALPREKLSQL